MIINSISNFAFVKGLQTCEQALAGWQGNAIDFASFVWVEMVGLSRSCCSEEDYCVKIDREINECGGGKETQGKESRLKVAGKLHEE